MLPVFNVGRNHNSFALVFAFHAGRRPRAVGLLRHILGIRVGITAESSAKSGSAEGSGDASAEVSAEGSGDAFGPHLWLKLAPWEKYSNPRFSPISTTTPSVNCKNFILM